LAFSKIKKKIALKGQIFVDLSDIQRNVKKLLRGVVCGQPWVVVLAYGGHEGRGVGVALEVRLHRFVMGENGGRESGKDPRVGNARRGIRI